MDTSRLLEKERSESDDESENSFPEHMKDDLHQKQRSSKYHGQEKSILFICFVVFLLLYFLASVPLLVVAWSQKAATSDYRIPTIPYCTFP